MQEGLVITQNFTGCIENIYLNSSNLIRDVKQAYEYGTAIHYERVNTEYGCKVINKSCAQFFSTG